MEVITRKPLREFGEKWPNAKGPLELWYRVTRRARWANFAEVKATFGQTDQAKVKSGNTVAVFYVGGNKYRLVAAIKYRRQVVYVLRVLTHSEYDADRWKEEL
jgi:mRNA interferase HigB